MLWVAVTALSLIEGMALRFHETSQNLRESDKKKLSTVIVHCDNRPLNNRKPLEVHIADMTFVELASMVDFAYAQKHGYEFVHYVLPQRVSHATFGARESAWGKLLALKHVGNTYPDADLLMIHDSDTAISDHAPSLPEFMNAFTPGQYDFKHWDGHSDLTDMCRPVTDVRTTSQLKEESGIWLNQGCKGHFILAKPGQTAWNVLRKAWNFPHNNYGDDAFPWEQAAWEHLAAEQTPGLMMIGGVNVTQDPDATADYCPAGIEIPGFNTHMCHFQSDSMLMSSYGDWSARARIRETLGCGADWQNKCKNNSVYEKAVSDHDNRHGHRKLYFLSVLRDLGYDDPGIHRLYREMRATVKYLKQDEADAAAAQLDDPDAQLDDPDARRHMVSPFRFKFAVEIEDVIPEGSRERNCWCDGPLPS